MYFLRSLYLINFTLSVERHAKLTKQNQRTTQQITENNGRNKTEKRKNSTFRLHMDFICTSAFVHPLANKSR